MLGKLLIDNPDILLLDEPTNHLDMDSIEWLEGYLKNYDGIVIIVSHDRYFLDNVVMKIIEIEDMESKTYKGNYSSYVKQKEEKLLEQMHNYKEQQKEIKSMEKTINDLRDWAMRADNAKFFKRAASMEKILEKMKNNVIIQAANERKSPDASSSDWIDEIAEWVSNMNFGKSHKLEGIEGVISFCRERLRIDKLMIDMLDVPVTIIKR